MKNKIQFPLSALLIALAFAACGKGASRPKAALLSTDIRSVSCEELGRMLNGTYEIFEQGSDNFRGRATFSPIGSGAFSIYGDSPLQGHEIDRATLTTTNGSCAIQWFSSEDNHHEIMQVLGTSSSGDIILTGLQLQPQR